MYMLSAYKLKDQQDVDNAKIKWCRFCSLGEYSIGNCSQSVNTVYLDNKMHQFYHIEWE